MNFNELFKEIKFSDPLFKNIELKLFSNDNKNMLAKMFGFAYDQNLNPFPAFTDHDHREYLLFLNMGCLRENEVPLFNVVDEYDFNRKTNPKLLYEIISKGSIILAPKLNKAIFKKDLDLFFKLIISNDYIFKTKNYKIEISIETEEHESF